MSKSKESDLSKFKLYFEQDITYREAKKRIKERTEK